MSNPFDLRGATAACLCALERYRNGGRSDVARVVMEQEVVFALRCLNGCASIPVVFAVWVLKPVESRLIDRFGREEGYALNQAFVDAIGRSGLPSPSTDQGREGS